MAKRQAQTAFEERLVEDEAFEESCEEIEAFTEAVKAARKQILEEPQERFQARVDELAAKHGIGVHRARVDDRLAKWVADYEPGVHVRCGEWRVPIKEYTTMEKVENGKGKKAGKPVRVKDE